MSLLTSILKNNARVLDSKPALSMKRGFRTKIFSYRETLEYAQKIAVLLQKNGVKKGDKIIICAPNSPYWIFFQWAILLLGCVVVPINIQSTKKFILDIIHETGAKVFIKHNYFNFQLPNNIKQLTIDYIDEEIEDIPITAFKEEKTDANDLAILMYTSGTTGNPKGVMLSNNNIYSNVKTISNIIRLSPQYDILLSILPLSHMYEQTIGFFLPFSQGVPIIYVHSYSAIKSLMRRYRITKMVSVPAFLSLIMSRIELEAKHKKRKKLLTNMVKASLWLQKPIISRLLFWPVLKNLGGKLNVIASGGSELNPELEKKWTAMGVKILQGYGLTETSPLITMNTPKNKKIGSVGRVIEGVSMKIAPDREILVKGPNVFLGYYQNEEKTKESFTEDNWFKTGDLGELDEDGFLFIKGRKKYIILGPEGQNIYPEDIEHELNNIKHVKDSCVVGLKKKEDKIEIHAALLLEDGHHLSPEEIIKQANNHLASYQKITGWTVWPESDFPRTVTKKIKKDEVKQSIITHGKESKKILARIKSKLIGILSRVTEVDAQHIHHSTKLIAELNLNSLSRVELLTWLEEDMGIVLNETDITIDTTVADLETMIEKKQMTDGDRPELKQWPRSYWIIPFRIIVQYFFFMLASFFIKLRVEGKENLKNLPLPVIFMPNHISYLDSLMVTRALPFKIKVRSSFAAAIDVLYEAYKNWVFLAEIGLNAFPLERRENKNVRPGLYFIGQMLDWHYSVIIYPEGRLSETGEIQNLQRGTGLLVTEMGVPVVPVKIEGTNKVVPSGCLLPVKRGEVTVTFGKPLQFQRSYSHEKALQEVEKAMKAL